MLLPLAEHISNTTAKNVQIAQYFLILFRADPRKCGTLGQGLEGLCVNPALNKLLSTYLGW